MPMTVGTSRIWGPSDTKSVTVEPRGAWLPPGGSVSATCPCGTTGSVRDDGSTTNPASSSAAVAASGVSVEVIGTAVNEPGPAPKYQPVPAARPVSSSTSAKSQYPRRRRRAALVERAAVSSTDASWVAVATSGAPPSTFVSAVAPAVIAETSGSTIVACVVSGRWDARIPGSISRRRSSSSRASRGRSSGSRDVAHATSSSISAGTAGFFELGAGTESLACW